MENKTIQDQQKLFLDDMKASGLSLDTLKDNHVKVFEGTPEQLADILSISLKFAIHLVNFHTIILFPYPDKEGLSDSFCRVKLLPEYETDDGRKIKYLQPKGVPTKPYIINNVWEARKNTAIDLLIVEGEKKALLLNQEGAPTIALPGVFNFRNSSEENSEGIDLNHELRSFNWEGRNVFIAFDADYRNNKNVRLAMFELAFRLEKYGAKVKIVTWEPEDGKGIDDYLVFKCGEKEENDDQ
jgi:hypothetical protein